MYKYIIICYLVCLLYAQQTYGPFNMVMTGAERCKGPKRRNCTDVEITVNEGKVTYHMLVKENTTPTKGKVVGISYGKEVLNLQIKSLCSHSFLRPLVEKVFNVTRNCVILKGAYTFTINIIELAHKYNGNDFIYGDWSFKSVYFNDDCNFDCLITKFKVTPKNKEINKHR